MSVQVDLNVSIQAFYKYQKRLFVLLGLWVLPPGTSLLKRVLYHLNFVHILLFWIVVYMLSMFTYLYLNINDLIAVIGVLYYFFMEISVFSKFFGIKMQNKTYKELIDLLHEEKFYPRNNREFNILSESVAMTRFTRNTYCILSLACLISWSLQPLMLGERSLPVSAYYPMSLEDNSVFLVMYIYQVIGMSFFCFINIAYDSWAASQQIHVCCLLRFLLERLKNIGHNTMDQEKIKSGLIECIVFHKDILKYGKKLEGVIQGPFTVQIGGSIIVICASFFKLSSISTPDDQIGLLMMLLYQICMTLQIFFACYFGNEIASNSILLDFYLYDANWFRWNSSNKKIMLIMMDRFKIPIKITAIKLYTFDLNMFTKILNSSYSCFALLRNLNK